MQAAGEAGAAVVVVSAPGAWEPAAAVGVGVVEAAGAVVVRPLWVEAGAAVSAPPQSGMVWASGKPKP